jgi:hypothetical protein
MFRLVEALHLMMAEEEKSNSQKDMEMPWKSPYETL